MDKIKLTHFEMDELKFEKNIVSKIFEQMTFIIWFAYLF